MKIKFPLVVVFTMATISSFATFASNTAGGEEQWQIVEENQTATPATSKPAQSNQKSISLEAHRAAAVTLASRSVWGWIKD